MDELTARPSHLHPNSPRNAQPSASEPPRTAHEGWLLKKRRKKMQGYARRYFTLDSTGLLSYAFEPGHSVRDQVHLANASISWTTGRKDITIDTNAATFHIKCITTKDYDDWMAAIRQYISDDGETRRKMSLARATTRGTRAVKAALINEEMAQSIKDLDIALIAFQDAVALGQTQPRMKTSGSSKRRHDDKSSREAEKVSSHHVFNMFRKSNYSHASEQPSDISQDSEFRIPLSPESSHFHHFEGLQEVLDTLKAQQAALSDTLRAINQLDHPSLSQSFSHAHSLSNSLTIASPIFEEEYDPGSASVNRARMSGSPTMSSHYKRSSTVLSEESSSIFFDAEDVGPEEFMLEVPVEEPEEIPEGLEELHKGSDSTLTRGGDSVQEAEGDGRDNVTPISNVARRTTLPSGPIGDEGSLFSVLKKNVGKDLATITMPASFNEPLTLLQRCAEEVEYYSLLDEAAATADPTERICLVAAFAMSGYAHTRYRSGRKGFTPLLGETFEDDRMKFVCEKVSHHPLVMAYHAEGTTSQWELTATSSGKTKFWGKSLEIIPTGQTYAKIGAEMYTWKKPSSFMRNLMIGSKYLEHCGELVIEQVSGKGRCVLEFKEGGYWGTTSNMVVGKVENAGGKVVAQLEGKWDEQLVRKLDTNHLRVLWRATPYPHARAQDYYGFTTFGISLNEMTEGMKERLPPTDSRLRPDVRALEEGNMEVAEVEKERLEEEQRKRRQGRADRQPRWFTMADGEWKYKGGYWEQRGKGLGWDGVEALF